MNTTPYTPSREGRGSGVWARRGWLATTLALGVALIVTSWLNYTAARGAVSILNAGQAEIISTALRGATMRSGLHGGASDLEEAELQAVLESQEEAGLRYIALLDSEGSVIQSLGEAAGPVALPAQLRTGPPPGGPYILAAGDRVRAFTYRPARRGGSTRTGGQERRGGTPQPGEQDRRREPQPRGGYFLLEFEPVPASNLLAQATGSLVLGLLGAALLSAVALVFWRQSVQYEGARREMEHQRRLSQLGEMSAVLAHEIRNPLASLKGNAQLLAERLEDGSRDRRRADRVVSEATRLEALTSDLLDFARTGPIDRRPADPGELLRAAADEAAQGRMTVDTARAPESWALDAARIRQALSNLLHNAWQVSPEGSPPVASVARENGRLIFEVRDFGPGLPEGDRERIFDPFFTTRTSGTGLGLPVARRVVELHGGTLEADDHPDGGAIFRIALPTDGE